MWADPVTVFYESFGSTSSNTAFSSYTGFSASTSMFTTSGNVNTHYSGDGKVGKNSLSAANLSSGYTGASGNSGCYHEGTANTESTIIQISNINIEGYESLSLSFGALGGSGSHKVKISYKIDNGTETALTEGSLSTSSWSLITRSITGTGSSLTLYLKHQPTNKWLMRIDDIKVTGVASLPSSAVSFGEKSPSITYPTTKTYSQSPSTATGYSGTITYSMTENTAGASIDASTGVVTVTKGGSVTVKATAAAVANAYTSSEDTYTLTVNDARAEAGLAWSAESANVTYGADNNIFPTLTNPHNVSVTYSSTNTDAATIDESGVITLKDKTATTQIRATFAGNDDYKDATVSYTLNVTKGAFSVKDGVFDFVEAAKQEPIEDYGSGMILSTSYTTADKTWKAGNVTMVTSKVSGNGYRWYTDGTLRFYNESKATFSVPTGYVITKIVTTGANFNKADVGNLSSSTWTGASREVSLSATATKNIETITVTYGTSAPITIACEGGYASYSCNTPLDFTNSEAEAYIIKSTSANSASLTKVTKVPANTGIIVKGTKGDVVNVSIANGELDDVTGNLLKSTATGSVAVDADKAYGLSKADGKFHLLNAGTIPANKAYLLASEVFLSSQGAAVLDLDFGETTGVNTWNVERGTLNGEVYNLNGQRVAQPTKGLYIVNGRKVVIK